MRILINDGWSFTKLPAGSTFDDAEKAEYEPVDLPHDWLIWQDNLYETADAWYRRVIELPEKQREVVIICFDGVYMDCDVLLNGEVIYTHPYGYTAFDVPLTGKLKQGRNVLSVHIRHQSPNSRWYSGSGIFRDVFLLILPEDHMIRNSLYLKESEENEGKWSLAVSVRTAGNTVQPFLCTIHENDGSIASSAAGQCANGNAEARLVIDRANPWSPDSPYLYRLTVQYGDDSEEYQIGLRSVMIDSDRGFILNGKVVKLKGVCLHHDLGALGAAFHEKAARRQLLLMKKMGANAVRTSHNPPASKFLDLCDEFGMLVIDEAFDMWEKPKTEYDYARFFDHWYHEDVSSWIQRDRIHPCVVMWSVGNEIYDIHASPRGAEVTKMLSELVRQYDPFRHAYTTFGCNYMSWEGGQRCAEYVDAVGYNYGEKLYEQHHADHPSWVIYGSETGSVLSSRGIYHFPIEQSIMSESDRQCSALGNSNTSWGAESLTKILIDDEKQTFSMGQFIWSGIDYIGEPTPYHTRSCYFGQADTACIPKDSYYLFQSFWSNQKMIHIGVTWDWNPGQMIDIPVITNCFEAELFLNGRSVGRKKTDHFDPEHSIPVWKLPFSPGEIRATGYDIHGNIICEDSRITPGETDHLVLSCEDPFILSDGWDIIFATVSAADKNGNPVENARDRVCIAVSGGGRLIGTDNGDSTDPDSYKSGCRRLFSGKLLLIIASNGKKTDVDICVTSTMGKTERMTIPVIHVPAKSGVSFRQEVSGKSIPNTVHARKILIEALDPTTLNAGSPECRFRYTVLPKEAVNSSIVWQVTNAAGIESPYMQLTEKDGIVTVRARGDGAFYLRALCMEENNCTFISQIEFNASGIGIPSLDPYSYLSAGLYDLHEGEIGAGNEKGIAFSRNGESMVGFSNVDFGRAGSDTITIDIFALNGDAYDLELWASSADREMRRISILRYQKPSIWNVYQPETWRLPERLTGVQSLFFRMRDKIHMKGFVFEKQMNAYLRHTAGSADSIYGDCFNREGDIVTGIGNNVTLTWNDMYFEDAGNVMLEIKGRTKLPVNTIHLRIKNNLGEETLTAAEFYGIQTHTQCFSMKVPAGNCTVSFVFLPGSSFDFCSFRFCRNQNWTEKEE